MNSARRELVLLLHGFGGNGLLMLAIQRRLRHAGFGTLIWAYPSLFRGIGHHADRLAEKIRQVGSDGTTVHVVSHSMGSIITRAALASAEFPKVGRLVMLAPPNQGSPIARIGESTLGRLCKPIADLSCSQRSYVNSLPSNVDAEVGVIAARLDNLVPVACTHLQGESDHLLLTATHSSLLFSKTVAEQTTHFLRSGRFHDNARN